MIHHRWDIRPTEAIAIQRQLARAVRLRPLRGPVATVAGVDCAFTCGGKRIIAAAVLCDARSMEVVATRHVVRTCRFPYVPGLLSFREAPAMIAAIRKLPEEPDLLMCDGQGLAHPRGLGLASHVGLLLDTPTIGVAKSRLCGAAAAPGRRRGARRRLLLEGKTVGAVVRTRTGVKPLYVSVGHMITLPEAIDWTLRCGAGVRLPEPTRQAHKRVSDLKARPSPAAKKSLQ